MQIELEPYEEERTRRDELVTIFASIWQPDSLLEPGAIAFSDAFGLANAYSLDETGHAHCC
jgi:hypothetical protein